MTNHPCVAANYAVGLQLIGALVDDFELSLTLCCTMQRKICCFLDDDNFLVTNTDEVLILRQ